MRGGVSGAATRAVLFALALLLVPVALAPVAEAQGALVAPPPVGGVSDWPQWRGPDGLGVAPEASGLPEEWGPESDNIRWRTQVPGVGYSSPIVSKGRVFLTSAYDGPKGGALSLVQRGGLIALALAIAWVAWILSRQAGRLLSSVSILFALLAILTVLRPELFLEAGNPGRTWRALSTLALLGLGAALLWLRPSSRWRWVGGLVLLLTSAYLAYRIPSGPRGPVPLTKAAGVVLPGLLAAVWGLWGAFRSRGRVGPRGTHHPWLALALTALAAMVFVPPNFSGGLQRVVLCLDLDSGEILWQRSVFAAPREQKSPKASYATPTPVTDGQQVFAYFGSGLAALDFDGRIQWVNRFSGYSDTSRYGAATSPVLYEDSVILLKESELYQDGPPTWLAAFDKKTGAIRWRVEPAGAHDSYGTPLLLADAGGAQLVNASWELLLGFDPESGERLWSHEYPMQQIASSMARAGDLVAVTGGNHGEKALMVFRVPAGGSQADPTLLWQSARGVATVVSPVIYGGLLFTVNRSGILTVYDVETGEEQWKKRLDGEFFSSPVAGDGKLFLTNTEGTTIVLAAEREHREIAANDLPDGTYASPAIAGGGLVIRTGSEIFFIEGAR